MDSSRQLFRGRKQAFGGYLGNSGFRRRAKDRAMVGLGYAASGAPCVLGTGPGMDAGSMHADDGGDPGRSAEFPDDAGRGFHLRMRSDERYQRQADCCQISNGRVKRHALQSAMISKWVSQALETSGLTQAEASRLLTENLRREIDRAAINKMISGVRAVKAEEMLELARITGFPLPETRAEPANDKALRDLLPAALEAAFSEALSDPALGEDIARVVIEALGQPMDRVYKVSPEQAMRVTVQMAVAQLKRNRFLAENAEPPSRRRLAPSSPNLEDERPRPDLDQKSA